MSKVYIDVYDYSGNKIANLYDSGAQLPGSAYGIEYVRQLTGNRTLSFSLPYMVDGVSNWRWQHIKAEYKVRLVMDDLEDWFVITHPKKNKGGKKISQEISCEHLSMMLKTKNLYMTFDETNGIGTAPYLMDQILAGTDWSFDEDRSDVFKENYGDTDGDQVKQRSLKSDNKEGAYALIGKVCDLFNAYPVFDAVSKTVSLHDLNNKLPLREMMMGVNLSALSVEYDSSNIVTRLYVEGDYQDDDYVTISGVNPTGLSYLLNFDYYKSIGAFTDWHQQKLDQYYADIVEAKTNTGADSAALMEKQSRLSSLWGNQKFVLWTVENGSRVKKIAGGVGEIEESKASISIGDLMYVFYHDETLETNKDRYLTVRVGVDTPMIFDYAHYHDIGANGVVTHVMKWINACSGSIGAKEVAIEAKQEVIDGYVEENNRETTDDATIARNNQMIEDAMRQIEQIYLGSGVAETFEYRAKVDGEVVLKSGERASCILTRASTNSMISTTTYHLGDTAGELTSDETVRVYSSGARLRFGGYGNSDILSANSSMHAVESRLINIGSEILNCTTAGKTFDLEIIGDTGSGNAIQLNGTTFSIGVSAIAYGLYEQYAMAVQLAVEVNDLTESYERYIRVQNDIEAQFMMDMGDMLKDGYWTDDNYIAGQEQYLYNDALDVMKEVSKPKVTYTVSMIAFADAIGLERDHMELNTKVRIYDRELNINDVVYVSKITKCIDDPRKSSVQISNEQVDVSSSFDSIFSRISDIARLIEQKKTIFERAKSLTSEGSLATERLEGAIDLLTTQISSSVSNWYTDDSGNIIFEAVDGSSAMKLSGDGWMIANGKTSSGRWNWRSAATGKGIVADSILTGYLSADRIEASSITAGKLASDVGASLDLSSNTSVRVTVQDYVEGKVGYRMTVTSDNGLFIRQGVPQVLLHAVLTNDGTDVTDSNLDAMEWMIDNEVIASGVKDLSVTADMIGDGGVIRCQIVKSVDSGRKDLFGAVIYEDRLFYDEVSVVNLDALADVRLDICANQPLEQVYDPNLNGGYRPDWHQTPLIITPTIRIDRVATTVGARDDVDIQWSKSVGGTAVPLGSNETINQTTGALTVGYNAMTAGVSSDVTYRCTVVYDGIAATESCSFRLHVAAASPKQITIDGPTHVFTYRNGVCTPNTITLTANASNVNFVRWRVLNSSGTYVNTGSTSDTITISNASGWFVDDVCTLMAMTDDTNVYDVYRIYKVTDSASSVPKTYSAFIRYSAYDDGREMASSATTDTKYIGMYVGPVTSVSQLTAKDFVWSKYTTQSVTVDRIVTEYNMSSGTQTEPPANDPKWSANIPSMSKGDFLWVRTTVKFTGADIRDLVTTYAVYNSGFVDALQYQTYVRYSAESTGRNMTRLPEADTAYIGFYTGVATTAPTSYAVYSWVPLNATQKTIVRTNTYYAISDTNTRPSSGWSTTMPDAVQGKYFWVRTLVTYSDNVGVNTYHSRYTGTEGTNRSTLFLTNEHLYFPSYYNGKCGALRAMTKVTSYAGIVKTAPIVQASLISYPGGKPDGISVSVGEYNETDGTTDLIVSVAEGSNLGSDGSITGEIVIPVSITNNGVTTSKPLSLTWHKVNMNLSGANRVVFDVYTHTSNMITGTGAMGLNAFAYDGVQDISGDAEFNWFVFNHGSWSAYQHLSDNFGHSTISLYAGNVNGDGLVKCIMVYNQKEYVKLYRVMDLTDEIRVSAIASGSEVSDSRYGSIDITGLVDRGGVLSDQNGLIWYRIDGNGSISMVNNSADVISVSVSDLSYRTYYICETSDKYYGIARIDVASQKVSSGNEPPDDPAFGDLWLDTSVAPNMLMCWVRGDADAGTADRWVNVTEQAVQAASERMAEFYVNKDEIAGYVKRTTYDDDLKAISERIGQMSMDDEKFQVMFSTSGVAESVSKEVNKYLRYSDGKLTLGSEGDTKENFKAQLTQDKLAFVYKGGGHERQVAYIGVNDMYITNARVTEALYLGDSEVGYFNWTVTTDGLGLKWVGRDA